jgi:S1-C subfamily serine protease
MPPRAINLLLFATLSLALASPAFAKGRLGFGVQMATDGAASTTMKEVKISDVRPNGPAEKAGLRTGDIVTEFAGQPVVGANGDAFKKSLGGIKQGEHLKLVVLRAGKAMPIDIVAGADQ